MRAVVVYESVFGNTREIAEAVAEGLRGGVDVRLCPVSEATADDLAAAELVVVGGPTHMHGMSSSLSRKMGIDTAVKKGEAVDESAEGPGLRKWFHEMPRATGVRGAAFDTRLPGSRMKTGSASKGIARRLRRSGYELAVAPESFIVQDAEGPPAEGELERARSWGGSLAAAAGA